MRTWTRTTVGIAMGATLTLFGLPTAHADDDSFAKAAQALGFTQGPENLVLTGRSACYSLNHNRDPDEVLARIIRYTRMDPDLGRQFFALAINEFCPQYSGVAGV